MTALPQLSCVMPTRNRSRFVERALSYFARQTFASRELIVIDDSDDPVEGLCSGVPGVRYIRCAPGELSLGQKLNLGVERAAGEFIIRWDDDDWYHPAFASSMLNALRSAPQPDQVVAGCGCYLIFVAGENYFRFSGPVRGAGGTLTFSKSLWRRVPFRDVKSDADHWFRLDSGNPVLLVDKSELYVAIRHGRNTWIRTRDGRITDEVIRGLPRVSVNLLRLFSAEEAAFYLSLPPVADEDR